MPKLPPKGPKKEEVVEIIKGSKQHLAYVFGVLAKNLNKNDYAHVVAVMQMLFIGHPFDCSLDGFEMVNLSVEAKKEIRKQEISKKIKTRHGNVISINTEK
jgi:hypothetical protein